ncbi:MAG TPA: hypothetical protein ACFCUY_15920 [Xenococcaceae cyanobacterium]
MEQEDSQLSPSELETETEPEINDLEDIDLLATKAPLEVKSYQENFIEEKSDQARIAESQKSTRGIFAIILISIYGATILLCLVLISWGMAGEDRKEILTLVITSQSTLIGSAIGFYFGKTQ